MANMELRLDATLDKLDNLSKDVEINRMDKQEVARVEGDVIDTDSFSLVADGAEIQYGSEVFEKLQKSRLLDLGMTYLLILMLINLKKSSKIESIVELQTNVTKLRELLLTWS